MRSARFEDWFARRINEPLNRVREMWDGTTYVSSNYHVELAWASWCAALGFEKESS